MLIQELLNGRPPFRQPPAGRLTVVTEALLPFVGILAFLQCEFSLTPAGTKLPVTSGYNEEWPLTVNRPKGRMAIPNKVGRFEILGELGRGPMTVDYRANDPATGRTVVLTVPSPESADSPDLLARFYREARAAGALQHPNIVAIYDLGVDRGSPFIARELLEGADLEQLAEREKKDGAQSPQSAATMLNYIMQACRGLAHAHQHGVIHRDVRPGTIFVTTRGIVKVTNFALARLPHASSRSSGVLVGTIDYMSPELICGDRVDGRADIWAVGCTLYEILTYATPFQGENLTSWMFAIMSQDPKPICELRPDLPAELDAVLRRALKKDRSERYRNMEKLLADLELVARRLPSAAGTAP